MEEKRMTLKEVRECSLNILLFVDKICKEQGLRYYLAAGTLLGAIRHGGFIPWDDDIDIMMPRKDYEKLIQNFPANETYAFLSLNNNSNIPYAYGKVVDKRTRKLELLRSKYQVIGVDIDVFPIDNYPNDLDDAIAWCNEIKNIQLRANFISATYSKGRNILRTIMRNLIVLFYHVLDYIGIFTVNKSILKLNDLSQKFNDIETDYCGIAAISSYGVKKRNHKKIYEDSIDVSFESYKFPAPIGYVDYLIDYYGDYMTLPPIEQRKTHHSFVAYWK